MQPPKIRAGDSVTWRVPVPEYPQEAGWQLHYALLGASAINLSATGGVGGDYRIETAATDTRAWQPGAYRWVAYVTGSDGERLTLCSGTLDIAPDLLTGEPGDARSHARRMLELIEAALEKRIPKDQQSYEIDGQRLDRIPIERLEALRLRYQREVSREQSGGRGGGGLIAGTVKWSYP